MGQHLAHQPYFKNLGRGSSHDHIHDQHCLLHNHVNFYIFFNWHYNHIINQHFFNDELLNFI